MKVQAGDVVHVRAVVLRAEDADGNVYFETICCGGRAGHWCRPDQIVHVDPRPLQVGDKVKRPKYHADDAEIKAIDGDKAWLSFPDGSHSTLLLANLERVA